MKTTQFYRYHSDHAKLTEFAGYEMPLWYTTTTDEHLAVRNSSGIFDVSHMGRFMVRGEPAAAFLERLVPTQVQKQPVGRAFYTLLLSDQAGIIDDLVILRLREFGFMLVVNAANAGTDMDHIKKLEPPEGVEIEDLTGSSAMVAVQGPKAQQVLQPFTDLDLGQLGRFRCSETKVLRQRSIISRTGYTGEDGFEVIILDASNDHPGKATEFWERLVAASKPCGLGARDSLRLEAGFPLHGLDIDQQTDPLQADLAWVLSPGKSGYVGSKAVSDLRTKPLGVVRRGVIVEQGIPRHGFDVFGGSDPVGKVTSGTFSPILRKGIALCRLRPGGTEPGARVRVAIRDSAQEAQTVRPPFYDERLYGWKRQGNGN
ncbi:MAG: glycine cleavage system aminomethyltransferase GcvT [Nitrososphaerales archaeon]